MTGVVGVSYMGTKRHLAATVKGLIDDCQGGIFLDAFSGMCSVGASLGRTRPIWSNDTQMFSYSVAKAHFCSLPTRPDWIGMAETCRRDFDQNKNRLERKYFDLLRLESSSIIQRNTELLNELFDKSIVCANKINLEKSNYDLFSSRFGCNYFGIKQCIEFDSIRFSLDEARRRRSISDNDFLWGVISLCVAASRSAATTGHFAQPLRPKERTLHRYISRRNRVIWDEWLKALSNATALGSLSWRRKNRAFNMDSLDLLEKLSASRSRPSIIYADPPYTKDQYSRYYHVYETIILYDYPVARGMGLYRDGRATSEFSKASMVERAFEGLLKRAAFLKADLVLSYPTNGLLQDSRFQIPLLIQRVFKRIPDVLEIPSSHSTLGASKGVERSSVTEVLYRVKF